MFKRALLGVAVLLAVTTANAFTLRMHPLSEAPGNPHYSESEIGMAVELVQRHYEQDIVRDVDVYVMEEGLLKDSILGFYDRRGPIIWIEVGAMENSLMRIYVLAHELGHHVMSTWETNDHCLMYEDGGYDHKILADLGVDNAYDKYIDPFAVVFVCGDEGGY